MAQVFAGGGRRAARGAADNAVEAGVRRLLKKAAPDRVALKVALVSAAAATRKHIADEATRTTLDKRGALDRIRLIKARKPWVARVALATFPKSRTIHAGRLALASSGDRIGSIPGTDSQGAFLLRRGRDQDLPRTGRERRIYRRRGRKIEAIAHKKEMGFFYRQARPFARLEIVKHTLAQRADQAQRARAAGIGQSGLLGGKATIRRRRRSR